MDVTFVKADGSGGQDRVYLTMGGVVQRGPVHVVHDLPHLVVESVFGIDDGLWAELEAGRHAHAARAVTARDAKRQKAGRIVSGAAEGVPASQWLTAGHRRAKVLTNAVANRFGDGPDSPAGVRDRVARSAEASAEETLTGIDDETIAEAITDVAVLLRRWESLPAGEVLQLSWPMPRPSDASGRIRDLSTEQNKLLVRRLIDEAVAQRNVDILDELAAGEFARAAKRWVRPFQSAFPDFEMTIVDLIAEGDTVVGHFKCSGTHRGEWLGVPATGRRFEGIDEIYIFCVRDGKLVSAFGVEDTLTRLAQLGISLRPA